MTSELVGPSRGRRADATLVRGRGQFTARTQHGGVLLWTTAARV